MLNKYSKIIYENRVKNNLTQKQLGEKLNVSAQAVSKWEHNQSEPDMRSIGKMAEIFNISVKEFFEEIPVRQNIEKITLTNTNVKPEKIKFWNFFSFNKPWVWMIIISLFVIGFGIATFYPYFNKDVLLRNRNAVFYLKTNTSNTTSGFFIDGQGTAVTTYNTIKNAQSATIGFEYYDDSYKYNVEKILGYDAELDIAIIKVDIKNDKYLTLKSSDVSIGEKIYTVSYLTAIGIDETVISKITTSNDYQYYQLLSTSIKKGGAVINKNGKVIGIITTAFSGDAGMSVAIPTRYITSIKCDKDIELEQNEKYKSNNYTIEFDGNGASNTMLEQFIPYNQKVKLNKNQFVYEGYEFIGWKCDGKDYADEQEVKNLTTRRAKKTMVAQWQIIQYPISYELDGGVNNEENPTIYTIQNGNFHLKAPTKNKFTFIGWYKEKEHVNMVKTLNLSNSENLKLYAYFLPNSVAENKITIGSKEELKSKLADANNKDKNFLLCVDIDLENEEWDTGITSKLKGGFDGNGHTISNILYSKNGTSFFGDFSGTYIQNLKLSNVLLRTKEKSYTNTYLTTGALAREVNTATIENCYVDNYIFERYSDSISYAFCKLTFGGLIGSVLNSAINNCYVTLNISKTLKIYVDDTNGFIAGGLVGYADNTTISNCYVDGCLSFINGYSNIKNSSIGGFIGNAVNTEINSCYTNCETITSLDRYDEYYKNKSSAFVGYISNCSINDSYATKKLIYKYYSYSYSSAEVFVGYRDTKYESTTENCFCVGNEHSLESILEFVENNWDATIWQFRENDNPIFKTKEYL